MTSIFGCRGATGINAQSAVWRGGAVGAGLVTPWLFISSICRELPSCRSLQQLSQRVAPYRQQSREGCHQSPYSVLIDSFGPLPLVQMDARDRLSLAIPISLFQTEERPQESWRGFSICRLQRAACISLPHLHIPVSTHASFEGERPEPVRERDEPKAHGLASQ